MVFNRVSLLTFLGIAVINKVNLEVSAMADDPTYFKQGSKWYDATGDLPKREIDNAEFIRRRNVYLMGYPAQLTDQGLFKLSYLRATIHPRCLTILEPAKRPHDLNDWFFCLFTPRTRGYGMVVDAIDDWRIFTDRGTRIGGRYLITEIDMNA